MQHWKAWTAIVLIPLALAACLFVPGKFTSVLTVHADRSFTYSYKGEILAVDPAGALTSVTNFSDGPDNATAAEPAPDPAEEARQKAGRDAQYREIAAKLAREAGYSVAEYRDDGKFYVEYAISGVLTHNFVFPYNQDTGLIFPFVAIELRGKDQVRVKAPGFAKQDDSASGGMGAGEDATAHLDGIFTLITDAEIVSQNQEDGATASGAGKTITWKVTPTSETAPTAVLRVRGI